MKSNHRTIGEEDGSAADSVVTTIVPSCSRWGSSTSIQACARWLRWLSSGCSLTRTIFRLHCLQHIFHTSTYPGLQNSYMASSQTPSQFVALAKEVTSSLWECSKAWLVWPSLYASMIMLLLLCGLLFLIQVLAQWWMSSLMGWWSLILAKIQTSVVRSCNRTRGASTVWEESLDARSLQFFWDRLNHRRHASLLWHFSGQL